MSLRPIALFALTLGGVLALGPGEAVAHGLTAREDLPIPTWLFTWGSTVVLLVSFVAMATLWPKPRLQQDSWRPLRADLSRVLASRAVEVLCGAIGLFCLVLVVWSGLNGVRNEAENFAPTFVYVIFWLGFLVVSVFLGDVFRAFNPWRAAARAVSWVATKAAGGPLPAPLQYPERLGRWPAVLAMVAFGWLEIASADGSDPRSVAIATLIYSSLTWIAMALYGIEAWVARGEGFSVYFHLISRISVFERRGEEIGIRRALSGLARWPPAPGSPFFVATLIGVVSFDGFSAGPTFSRWIPDIADVFRSLGVGNVRSIELTFGFGMIAVILLTYGFYRLGIWGAKQVGGGFSARELAASFAHSLAPIALVYAAAHYFSFLVLQGQAIIPLASDPLGDGSDLFGTAGTTIEYGLIAGSTFWYIQVAYVLIGHVAALMLAHDRAIAMYERPKLAVRSQFWMLAVMVGFTTLALWLLSEASKG